MLLICTLSNKGSICAVFRVKKKKKKEGTSSLLSNMIKINRCLRLAEAGFLPSALLSGRNGLQTVKNS